MADLKALQEELARNTSLEKSIIGLVQGLAARITAAGTDPVALKDITDELKANDDALAAAILAGTPADPTA